MDVSLTPELEKLVQQKVDSGLYGDASEVIREALRVALQRESDDEWLRREAAIGFAQLEGEPIQITSKEEFFSLARAAE
jgi:antitoxin ParD1/3/4